MGKTKLLIVDDDPSILFSLSKVLGLHGFEVKSASNVIDALKLIGSQSFDVLLSDLHMPGAGDGLTVVSAMRHANPKAVTLLLSAFPEMNAAANAILQQTDEVLVKPVSVPVLVDLIQHRMASGPLHKRVIASVASILESSSESSIQVWFETVEKEPALMKIPMSRESRTGHLPQMFRDLVTRLRSYHPLGSKNLRSEAAVAHGALRRQQGYTAAMLVEESRILQVTTFETLQKNLTSLDFSVVLLNVMTIADEVDSQLSQAMASYVLETAREMVTA